MKKLVCLLTATAALALYSTANASITDASWTDDGDGVITCGSQWTWTPGTSSLWMYGDHNMVSGEVVGHMVGDVTLDSIEDPTLTLSGTIDNQTGNAWYGYQINVVMSMPFNFVSPGPSIDNPPIGDWFVAGVTAPTLQVGGLYDGQYEGTLYFSKGTEVMTGGSLDFVYSVEFGGILGFSFTQEMIPWFTVIPEPSTVVLAGIGGLMLALRLRRNRIA